MSKSAESDASRINLLDPPDVLASKIKRAKTDGEPRVLFPALSGYAGYALILACMPSTSLYQVEVP